MLHETSTLEVTLLIAIVKTLILVVGGVITFYAFKAYRRTQATSLGYLAAGFAIVTLGALLGGLSFELLDTSLAAVGVLIESAFILAGFALIAYSLMVTDSASGSSTAEPRTVSASDESAGEGTDDDGSNADEGGEE